jgi:hypothetical protein
MRPMIMIISIGVVPLTKMAMHGLYFSTVPKVLHGTQARLMLINICDAFELFNNVTTQPFNKYGIVKLPNLKMFMER